MHDRLLSGRGLSWCRRHRSH